MKLVDILAQKMKAWPESAHYIVMDDDGQCWPSAGCVASAKYNGSDWSSPVCGSSFYFQIASDNDSSKVTRQQWQAAVDALEDPAAPEWNGEGPPPVGTVCEVRVAEGFYVGAEVSNWRKCEVVHVSRSYVIVRCMGPEYSLDHEICHERGLTEFRPIRTAEQIAEEERKTITDDIQRVCVDGENNGLPFHEALYQAGYRKQVSQ